MKKGNDQTTYLFMAGALAIVAIVALVLSSSGSLEGAATSADTLCTDDDPTDDFYVAGTIKMGTKIYEDYCLGKELLQKYCQTGKNVKTRKAYTCSNGCLNGACLK